MSVYRFRKTAIFIMGLIASFSIIGTETEGAEKKPRIRLGFTQALERMEKTNEALKAVKLEQKQAKYKKRTALGLYFPKVDMNFMYTHLNDSITMDFNPLKNAMIELSASAYASAKMPAPAAYKPLHDGFVQKVNADPKMSNDNFIKTMQEQNFWTLSVVAKQPIFTGGKIIAANKAARASLEASNEKLKYTRNKLTTELAQRYFGVRLFIKVAEVRKEVLAGMAQHLDRAKKMEAKGMIARAEELHAEVSYADAEREYQKSLRDVSTAQSALKNTVSLHENIEPVSHLFITRDVKDLQYYKDRAGELNPALKQLKAHKEMAHQGYMKELASYSPTLFAFGSADVLTKNHSDSKPDWFVGLGATYTLFDGLQRYSKLKTAKSLEQKVAALVHKARRDIDTLVEKSYNDLMKDAEQIRALDKSIEFAEEYLRVREKAFSAGFATSIDVVDARLNLSRVKIGRLKAMYEMDVSLAKLLEVCGMSDQFNLVRTKFSGKEPQSDEIK